MERRREVFLLAIQWLAVFVHLSASFGNSNLADAKIDDAQRRRLAAGNQGLISIDCGADQDYFDELTGIHYKSDRDFISTGENHDVSTENKGDRRVFSPQFNNLRSFPHGRKNCYILKPEQGKNRAYEIRFFFKYGNYDGRNETPTFDLYMGVNYLMTVEGLPGTSFTHPAVTFFLLTDVIHLCLVNTGKGTPFISLLELQPLNTSMYEFLPQSPVLMKRFDLGSSDQYPIVRFQDDIYHRIWATASSNPKGAALINTPERFDIQGSDNSYRIPTEVLQTAVQAESFSVDLPLSENAEGYHVCFHIAEIVTTGQAQLREFNITVNGDVIYGPSTAQYLKPQTLCFPKNSPFPGGTTVSIYPARSSSLPPLVNAWELLEILPFNNSSPTDSADVDAILAIKNTYKINRESWQEDPCVPKDLSWNGLNCSNSNFPPRIISVNLSRRGLSGDIASSFSDLKVLQSLDLSYNELTGEIPESLGELQNLAILNLRGNNLKGSIPQSLREKAKNGELQLSLDDNPNLCLTASCRKNNQLRRGIIAAVVSVVGLLLLCSVATYWRMKGKRAETLGKPTEDALQRSKKYQPFKYSEIVSVTNNFEHVIGKGGFGNVYLGNLKDGPQVAVKLLSQSSMQGNKEFRAEVQLLMTVHHRNLVSLIGYCDEHKNKALVYEYMANGSLREHLLETSTNVLSWSERLQVAVDAAYGLEYLHNGYRPPIIHRDLKAANILLNENLQAKICDFGLSRIFATEEDSHVTTSCLAGTPGYLDPELEVPGNFNKKSDVFSFGVLLLEIITGRSAMIRGARNGFVHIVDWVRPKMENGDIQSIVDQRLQGEFNTGSAWRALETAMSCAASTAERPDMSQVLAELKECWATEMASVGTPSAQANVTSLNNLSEVMTVPHVR